jgi:hypothetical protein
MSILLEEGYFFSWQLFVGAARFRSCLPFVDEKRVVIVELEEETADD